MADIITKVDDSHFTVTTTLDPVTLDWANQQVIGLQNNITILQNTLINLQTALAKAQDKVDQAIKAGVLTQAQIDALSAVVETPAQPDQPANQGA